MSLKRLLVLPAALAALIAHRAMAQEAPKEPLLRGGASAPFAALVSNEAAVRVAFGDVCLRGVLEGRDYGELALYNHLVPTRPTLAGAGPDDRAWRLASLGDVYVVAWKDGSCSTSYERGDAEALVKTALAIFSVNGVEGLSGLTEPTDHGKAERRSYCAPGDNPVVTALTVKVDRRAKRPALVTTSFRAKALRPSFCGEGRPAAG